ncbi:MAG: Lpg1974 family pore-forming outer membrane protein [Planctomycetota bacterium]
MRTSFWRTAALVGCMTLLLAGTSIAQPQREYQIASDAAAEAGASLVSYNSFDPVGTADYEQADGDKGEVEPTQFVTGFGGGGGRAGLGVGLGFMERPGQFFFGAEYIYARASFSEALAFVVRDSNAVSGGDEFVEYDFDYTSSYSFYGGYRVPDCGCAIVFDFTRLQSDAAISIDPIAGQSVFGPYEINDSQRNYADVDIQSYDIGLARAIPLGGFACCNCGTGVGAFCPYWDISWSAGLRFAEVGWGRSQNQLDATTLAVTDTADTALSFEGVGGRVGIGGRRYFGEQRWFSIYANGDISLLVGNMAISTITQGGLNGSTPQAPVFSHRNSARRVIPVTEIEAGASAHVGNHLTLSSGYFISAWHDLGMRDTYDFGGAFQVSHYDDANILGFDGFFARAEIAF